MGGTVTNAILGGLRLHAVKAGMKLEMASRLTEEVASGAFQGAEQAAISDIADFLGAAGASFKALADKEAQAFLGPGVNTARKTWLAVDALADEATRGLLPSADAVAGARINADTLAARLAEAR